MSVATVFGICASFLVGIGLYGMVVQPHPLRKMLSFNVLGAGTFLLFGAIARRGAEAGLGGDPVPQALVITGMVVSFSATALGIAILLRFFEETGEASLRDPTQSKANESDRSARIARISSSARPVRMRSTGRRSPSIGFTPNSHESAASRSYKRRRFDQTSSRRSTFSALSGSIPAPRSQRSTWERFTPSRSASCAAERKSARRASTFRATATGI